MSSKIIAFTFTIMTMLAFHACTSSKSVDKDDKWSLNLEKGGCLDVCQSYSIVIQNNGEYAYTGKFKVKHRGKKKGNISQQQLADLKKLLTDIKWKELKPAYDQPALDSQRNIIEYTSESIQKKITYSQMEPQELRTLEIFINTLIDQDDF